MLSTYYGDVQFSIKYSLSGRSATSEDSQLEDVSNVSCKSGSISLWIRQANNLFTNSYKYLPNAYVKWLVIFLYLCIYKLQFIIFYTLKRFSRTTDNPCKWTDGCMLKNISDSRKK